MVARRIDRAWLCAGLLITLAISSPVEAAVVNEVEVNGEALNNTIATAQAIGGPEFTLPVPPTVFDAPAPLPFPTVTILGRGQALDVDFYSFEAQAGDLLIDIDNDEYSFPRLDTIVSLFDSAGTLIGYSGDDFGDPGSTVAEQDSFLGTYTLTAPGTYYVAISTVGNEPLASLALTTQFFPMVRPDLGTGGFMVTDAPVGDSSFQFNGPQPLSSRPYTLHISLQNPQVIPEPSSLALMGLGLGALGLYARRRAVAAR